MNARTIELKKLYKNCKSMQTHFTKVVNSKVGNGVFECQELCDILTYHPDHKVPVNVRRFQVMVQSMSSIFMFLIIDCICSLCSLSLDSISVSTLYCKRTYSFIASFIFGVQ